MPAEPLTSPPHESPHGRRICLTPTRNEGWIVDPFLAAARTWADDVIVADQKSTDGTMASLRAAAGVEVLVNEAPGYDESHRQKLLLRHARQIPGRRILLGLDADEAFSANHVASPDWARIEAAPPGTVLRFRWVNLLPGFKQAWIPPGFTALGFVDDGAEHTGARIHSPRVPHPPNAPVLDLNDIVVLHFQYAVWERMESKQRWYQAWEHTQHRRESPLEIFRHYHHMHGSWADSEIHPVRPEWLEAYDRAGIDFRSLRCEPVTWWDREMVEMLREHGADYFRRVAIWDQDWNAVARRLGVQGPDLRDPRSGLEKIVHRLLAATQHRRAEWRVRGLERLLRATGW